MFNFDKDYIIGNKVVLLQPLEEKHVDLLYPISNNKKIWKHFKELEYGSKNGYISLRMN